MRVFLSLFLVSSMAFAFSGKSFRPSRKNGPFTCPTNFIMVPALPGYTTQDFCVAKYEMKNVSGVATSQATLTPWYNITRTNARTNCAALGSKYGLITNSQWQSIARNIEGIASNWSTGIVGSGSLNKGHSDTAPGSPLAADVDDNNACAGTGQTCSSTVWHMQRRTHNLSNGNVIWDLGGNLWEWIYEDFGDLPISPTVTSGWKEFTNVAVGLNNISLFGSVDPTRSSTEGIGQVYGGSAGAIHRGGYYSNLAPAGIFTTGFQDTAGTSAATLGYRCVFIQ